MARPPRGISNRAAFESHGRAVASDLRGTGIAIPRERDVMAIGLLFAAWAGRYGRRRDAFGGAYGGPALGDTELAERLAARWRTRDAAIRGTPAWWDAEAREQIALSYGGLHMAGRLDAATAEAPHGFGPSFRALCLEAEAQGATGFGAVVDRVLAWARAPAPRPPSAASLTKIAPLLERQLRWRETGDDGAPWQAEVEGRAWLIRLGDFPDEPPYLLEIDGALACAVLDWPTTWLRGAAAAAPLPAPKPPAPAIAPAAAGAWPQRYAEGDCVAVWAEMTALGPGIRDAACIVPAEAVARETMRRVRHNIGLLVPRLEAMGYRFGRPGVPRAAPRVMLGGRTIPLGDMLSATGRLDPRSLPPGLRGAFGRLVDSLGKAGAEPRGEASPPRGRDVFAPATPGEARILARLARRGAVLPLALRFWIEEVGRLDLTGWHAVLCPPRGLDRESVLADPLAIAVDAEDVAEQLAEHRREDDPVPLILAYSPADKAAPDAGETEWEDGLAIAIPDAAADAPLTGAAEHAGLVPYLRLALRWGGFPGWEGRSDAPRAEIARLNEGMVGF